MSWFDEDRGRTGAKGAIGPPGPTGPPGIPPKFAQLMTGTGEAPMLATGEVVYFMETGPSNTLQSTIDSQYGHPAHIILDGPGLYQIAVQFQFRCPDNPTNFNIIGLTSDPNSWYDLADLAGTSPSGEAALAKLNGVCMFVNDGTVLSVHVRRDNQGTGFMSTSGAATFTVTKLLAL